MDADGLALARAIVALPGWSPWPPGMGWTIPDNPRERGNCSGLSCHECEPPPGALPDLDDPATDGRSSWWVILRCVLVEYPSLGRACAAVMIERGWVAR